MNPIRLSYNRVEAGQTIAGALAYLPITLSTVNGSVELQGLLDSGSTVNVLPYTVGLTLGFSWEQQTIPIALTGSLSKISAYGVVVTGKVASFLPMEFDVCFFRSQAVFEVKPKVSRK